MGDTLKFVSAMVSAAAKDEEQEKLEKIIGLLNKENNNIKFLQEYKKLIEILEEKQKSINNMLILLNINKEYILSNVKVNSNASFKEIFEKINEQVKEKSSGNLDSLLNQVNELITAMKNGNILDKILSEQKIDGETLKEKVEPILGLLTDVALVLKEANGKNAKKQLPNNAKTKDLIDNMLYLIKVFKISLPKIGRIETKGFGYADIIKVLGNAAQKLISEK